MKPSITMMPLICFVGLLAFQHARPEVTQGPRGRRGLTEAELRQVRARLPCLKPGMQMKEVFDTLGVDLPGKAYAQWGSGPSDDYRWVYQLAPATNKNGYNLVVVNDRQSKFKRAGVACWEGSKKCEADTKEAEGKGCPVEAQKPEP